MTTPRISTRDEYNAIRQARWDEIARAQRSLTFFSSEYHRRLREVYGLLISPGQRVLEIGCGRGDLLAALEPSVGVGVDFSGEMLNRARQRHPELTFVQADAHAFALDQPFDATQDKPFDTAPPTGTYPTGTMSQDKPFDPAQGRPFDAVILSDLVNDVWDVQDVLERVRLHCAADTRVILNVYSRVYQPALSAGGALDLANRLLPQNWLTPEDTQNLLHLAGFEVIRHQREILLPLPIPGLRGLFNKILVKLWPFSSLAWTNVFVARPEPRPATSCPQGKSPEGEPVEGAVKTATKPTVSVIIPARNEAGNIEAAFQRLPELGSRTEIIFVEGHSRDNTVEAIEQAIKTHPERPAVLFHQTGKGKADAVRLGFEKASGDVLMILDADLTVRPEDLTRFYEALVSGKGEFINGVRLVYPMQGQAMRFLNLVGNKAFSMAFSWLLGQSIKDTLCGTKVLWKRDYERIVANHSYFGEFDPFGDYDLIFGAAKQNRKIVDMPIRYQDRTYGATNIDRWRHGALLFQMVLVAAFRLKFV
jgi:SAM-dependent methyltransferase